MVLLDYLINTFLFNPPPPPSSSFPKQGAQQQQQQQSSWYEFGTAVDFVWTARGERIAVTHLRQRGAAITILYSHANAEDLNQAYPFMHRLAVELNVNVVGYDYSGYGASSGTCVSLPLEKSKTPRFYHVEKKKKSFCFFRLLTSLTCCCS